MILELGMVFMVSHGGGGGGEEKYLVVCASRMKFSVQCL